MDEYVHKYYLKEEEFLKEYEFSAYKAAAFLEKEWTPNPDCNDAVRSNHKYFMASGEQSHLFFDAAAVFHKQGKFSSVQIALKSSHRLVTVRVKWVGEELIAEKVMDRPQVLPAS